MDGISSEMTEEKDNITRPVRRRHSSILKPPRSPLQDLRSGNETVQESSALRNRKSSRRVSFADTIKVFQTESHMTTVRKSEITETETRENILNIQNKDSDDNYCEITGMDTLLCAPIQIQQKELAFIEHNYERKQANDQTVIFSDENQMDLTASHTVLITKGLLDCSASEKSMKIDTTSFLANLKHNAETSTMKNELKCSMSQNTSPAKKINWNDFITRLKTGKYIASSTGPDKENSEMLTYSKESNSAASTHQMHVSANVDENGSNRTRIFSEQDNGMNFTQCHTGNIQTLVPPFSNANLGEFKEDITIYGSECMDLTTNHVMQVLHSASNISEKENRTQNLMMDVATVCEAKAPEKKSVLKDKLNAAFQDSFLNPRHITRSHIMGSETCTVPQTCKQDARTLVMTSESLCSSQVIQCDKTAFFSSCNDAMEVTMCLSGMTEEKALLKHDGNYSKTCSNPDASPLPTEKTICSGEDSMDITKSHTVAIDNNIFKQDQPNTKKEIAISISGKEVMFQNQITVPESGKMNINYSSVPQVSKERLLQSPINSLPISDKKTKLLAGDCMDLTESYISNLRSQAPLESCDLAPENITKSHSKSLSDEWEKMTKSLIQPSQQLDKHILTDTQSKEKHQVLKISSCLDKDSPSVHYNEDTAANYNRAHCGELDKQIVVGHKEQGQHSELPEPQKKNLNEPTLDCFHDKIICSEEEQTMDLTKSHTVVIGFGPSEVQEPSDTNLGHRTSKHTTVSRQIAVNVEKCDKNPPGKTRVIITNDMAELEDRTQKLGFLKEKQNNKICRRKSVGGLKIDKTIIFSEGNGNDMDITKSYTVEINHRPVLGKHDSELMLLAGTSKTALYACGQDDMEITRSHTSESDCRTVTPHEKTSRPLDKTVMFVDDHDELEMTESHTVFIDYQAEDKTVLPDRLNLEQSKRKSLQEPKVTSAAAEESVSFSGSGHPAIKDSQLTVLEEGSSSGPRKEATTFIADNTDVSKLTTRKNVKDLQKPGFLNELLSGKSQRRNSLEFKNGKTIEFSENDKSNIDNPQSPMVGINNKLALREREDFNLVPLAETSKIALYACGQDDMEITRSHTSVSDCRTVTPHEKTSRPLDKTVMFVDDHDELEMTKSHTVFIDYQAEDKTVLPDRLNLEQSKRKSLQEPKVTSAAAEESVSFSENNESVRVAAKGSQLTMLEEESSNRPRKEADDLEVTKSHTVFIDCQATEIIREYPKFEIATGKNLNHSCAQEIIKKQTAVEQKHLMTMLIPTHTLSGEQNKMEIIKCHRTDIEEKVTGKDQACVLEEAKTESCHLNSTDRRNVHLTTSHIDAVCGSSDNYSCLPNVTSDKLEGNPISFADKNKEKASNCQVKNELINVDNLASGYCIVSERLPLFASCPLKEEIIQTNSTQHLDCVITVPTDQDLMKGPQNQTLVCDRNLEEMAKVNKRVSFKLPNEQVNVFVDDICVASQPHLSTEQLQPSIQKGQNIVNKDEMTLSNAGNKSLDFLIENSSTPTREKESKILSNEKHLIVSHKKELKESIQKAECNTSVDCISNLDLTTQVIETRANDGKAPESTVISNVPGSSIVRPSLNNFNGKTEEILDFQAVHLLPPSKQLLELEDKTQNNMREQAIETHDIVSNDVKDKRDEETHNGVGTTAVPPKRAVKDKMRRCSLGIFLPKLPNKRNCSVTGTDDLEQIPADLNYLETQPVSSKDSGIGSIVAKLNLSPSQYINEENLPLYPGEINSLDSISTEIEEKALTEISHKEILPFENKMEETCNIQKRTWVQEDDDVPAEKKVRKADTTQEKEIFDHHTEEDNDKNVNSVLIKSLSRTPSSCSSSLDSIKADGTSLDFSTHRNSQMESQFLDDTIGEENLREKLKDGRITIREFFILLQVHILIQKPRQSNLPAKFTINTSPIPEDLMLRQYVYGPKIQIYREDCEILRQKIEELKVSALNQDKLLTDVNRNLWEKMRHCSDEELKTFGIYLNKIKSSYTKMTKVFTHQGKVALYSKLVHSAQNEKEKLQIRINEMDSILKKINNCLTEVEIETKNLENEDKYNPTEEWDSEMRTAEKELEQLKMEEEELQRKLLEVEIQKEQALSKIQFTQKQVKETEELLDHLSLSEWNGIEWSDDQAVFTFVYDSIELTILFGEPVVGVPFLNKTCRAIAELNFQSILDEDKAPPSSLLVHKLIFQYIDKQESWKKKCITQHQVPQMLQELSLVVNHCRLLGEEIEFLKRWGPNYNLMNIDINDTKLKLLFSSYAAFVKFEITFSLSAYYPMIPLPFTIQSQIGNTDHNEIATIISKVPFEDNYLKNVVKQIYQDLLKIDH